MIANAVSQLEIRIALRLIALEDRAQTLLDGPKARQYLLAFTLAAATIALLMFTRYALGADGAEFASASKTVEGWAAGNVGKIIMTAGIIYGSYGAVFKKDTWLFVQPAMVAVGFGLLLAVIDGEFTATI